MPETHSHLRGEHKNKAEYKHSSRVPQSDKGLSSIHSTSRNAHSSTGQSISVCRSVLGQTRLPQINQCNFTVLARETGPVAFRQVTAPPRSRGTQRPALSPPRTPHSHCKPAVTRLTLFLLDVFLTLQPPPSKRWTLNLKPVLCFRPQLCSQPPAKPGQRFRENQL